MLVFEGEGAGEAGAQPRGREEGADVGRSSRHGKTDVGSLCVCGRRLDVRAPGRWPSHGRWTERTKSQGNHVPSSDNINNKKMSSQRCPDEAWGGRDNWGDRAPDQATEPGSPLHPTLRPNGCECQGLV